MQPEGCQYRSQVLDPRLREDDNHIEEVRAIQKKDRHVGLSLQSNRHCKNRRVSEALERTRNDSEGTV
jgi:hypothetical protein